jgi:hypothetical protein
MFSLLSCLFLGLAGLVVAKSNPGQSVLVVLEPTLPKADYSIFFKDLEGAGSIFASQYMEVIHVLPLQIGVTTSLSELQ